MAAFRNSNLWTWADGYWLLTRQPGTKWHLPLQNDQGWHTKMKRKTNYIVRKERNIKRSMLRKKPLEMCSIAWLSVVGKVKRQHDITTEKTERPLSKSIQTRKSRAMFVKGTLCQVWRVRCWSLYEHDCQRALETQCETDDVIRWFHFQRIW